MYLEMYKRYGTKEIISPTLSKADFTITNPSTAPLWLGVEKGQERWSWCDALFMAPRFMQVFMILRERTIP